MRYIDINSFRPSPAWQTKAKNAADAVLASPPEQRSRVIDRNKGVWGELKDDLSKLSHRKCWYCESIDDRSDNVVDHYRPKGNVRDANPPHNGYWWLAFSWDNYRFSCMYCNSIRKSAEGSGGKQDYFPLNDESRRALCENDDYALEMPLLLDPTNPMDVSLIAFSEDGSAGPADEEKGSLDYRRANESIKRYHLNHPDIKERRAEKLRQVRSWVVEADTALQRKAKDPSDPTSQVWARRRIDELLQAVYEQSAYSAAVKHLLAGMAGWSRAARIINSL
jgi:uncharacterized protein (TIGR02646 family)